MVSSISIKDLLNQNNPNIIDIRSIEKYNNNHIPKAINIPFEKLITNQANYLNKETMYYLYCQKGITSRKICQILYNMEYKITNISGGYEEWVITKED